MKFQIRLLLYLLLAGSIPLLAAIFIFYRQSSAYTEQQVSQYAEQAHEQWIGRMNRELQATVDLAADISADYAVQTYAKQSLAADRAQEMNELKVYMDHYLQRKAMQHSYVEQLCLTLKEQSRMICSRAGEVPESIDDVANGPFQSFEPAAKDRQSASDYVVSYTDIVTDQQNKSELGYVTVWLNLSKWAKPLFTQRQVNEFLVTDGHERIILRYGDDRPGMKGAEPESILLAAKNGNESGIRSVKSVEVPGGQWVSYYSIPGSLSPYHAADQRMLLLVFAILAVVSAGSSVLFSRHVTGPLHQLKALMSRAERGDLRAYWTSKGSDEWNDLGQSYNQMLNRLEDLIKQVKLEESLKKEAEMEALHYQLNPHFLYNTLNTMKWVAKIHKTPQISEVVSALVRLLQASLGKKGEFITLREESALVRDYMEIQAFRYGDKVKVAMEMDELTLGCLVPRMLLQPLVENAIIHGIEPAKREGIITIRTWLDRDLLFCQVEDNGIGMAQEKQAAGGAGAHSSEDGGKVLRERMSGIGLSHIRQKIKLYYGPEYKLHIVSKPGEGCTIRMSLPIHQSEV